MTPLLPIGLSLFGGLLGRSERPTLDPRMLNQLFGPQAIGEQTNMLYRILQSSPVYQNMMRQGALRGSQVGSQLRSNLARRGVGTSPIAGFQSAASRGYGAALQNRGQAELFNEALQAALQNISGNRNAYVQSQLYRQNQPTFGQRLGSSLVGGGGMAFTNLLSGGSPGGGGGGGTNPYDMFGLLKGLGG